LNGGSELSLGGECDRGAADFGVRPEMTTASPLVSITNDEFGGK